MEHKLTVRMYDVGFGDCFLLKIPTPAGERKVLFDCGTIKKGSLTVKQVVQQVIEDLRPSPEAAPRADIVIATHRHRDHILGFADPAWAGVEVGEVWMPWTEDPSDALAIHMRMTLDRVAAQLTTHIEQRLQAAAGKQKQALLAYQLMVLNATSNEDAMQTLRRGFSGKPTRKYLPVRDAIHPWFEPDLLPGVTVHVLGPSHDPNVITELDPPIGQSYLKVSESLQGEKDEKPCPFGSGWQMEDGAYQDQYPGLIDMINADRQDILEIGLDLHQDVAIALDKALNGTSLMLVFEIGAAKLLFPGDAQWGTWRKVLESNQDRQLVSGTTFYKVGHHGSHNATPVQYVDGLGSQDLTAMISVTDYAQWPEIPKQDLLDALAGKTTNIARSDQPDAIPATFSQVAEGVIETKIPY